MYYTLKISTPKRIAFVDITSEIEKVISKSEITSGICYLYVPHTTCGITINENYDPSVTRDINNVLSRLIPKNGSYEHTEGNADAHIKTSLINSFAILFFENKKLILGTWQGVFLCEFDGPRERKIYLKIIPD
ncbi:MAG: secondary thiamine-phosphate synthase enzyme YjbQ [candidate division WOR-3 bacterium]|uniref:YjbQ family protein n=1 Tax=candidate division WOR-3 bacterium TaxID=2052148 RepID=A0A7C4S129_UNCW3